MKARLTLKWMWNSRLRYCHGESRAFGGEDWKITLASQHHDEQSALYDTVATNCFSSASTQFHGFYFARFTLWLGKIKFSSETQQNNSIWNKQLQQASPLSRKSWKGFAVNFLSLLVSEKSVKNNVFAYFEVFIDFLLLLAAGWLKFDGKLF